MKLRLKGFGVSNPDRDRGRNGAKERASLSLKYLSLFVILSLSLSQSLFAQEPFYKGKTIRIVVGYAAGGGYDLYSRTIARHMGKQIPGNPNLIVENMPGAGSLISANQIYKTGKPDGLTIGLSLIHI